MSKIIKAMHLDFLLIKEYFKTIIYLVLITIILSISIKSISAGLVMAMTILAMRVVSLPFESEEKTGINKFYEMIPILKTQRIYGRYFFTVLIGVVGAIISLLAQLGLFFSMGIRTTIIESAISLIISLFIYIFTISLQIPFFYKFGAIKGRLGTVFPLIGFGAFYYLSGNLINWGIVPNIAIINIFNNNVALGLVMFLFSTILLTLSIKVSIKLS